MTHPPVPRPAPDADAQALLQRVQLVRAAQAAHHCVPVAAQALVAPPALHDAVRCVGHHVTGPERIADAVRGHERAGPAAVRERCPPRERRRARVVLPATRGRQQPRHVYTLYVAAPD